MGGRESRICETAVAGYVRAMFVLCSRQARSSPHCNGLFRVRVEETNVRNSIEECNCRLPDAWLKVTLGCKWCRCVIGECN